MDYFGKRYHPPGTSPGTLAPAALPPAAPLSIRLIDYTDTRFLERDDVSPDDCLPFLQSETITWIHLQGEAEPEVLRRLGEIFGIHPLALEDVINSGQRPKADGYGDQLFLVLAHPTLNEAGLRLEQVSLLCGHNLLISFHNGATDPFEPVRRRLREHAGRIRGRGADYLLYALVDITIDHGFPVLEWFGAELEALEETLIEEAGKENLRRLHELRRDILLLRRMLWPHRELLSTLARGEEWGITEESRVYLRDCYDHAVQILDLLETYREMTTGLLDLYLSSTSNRLNEIMRVLTVFAAIFIPLSFIAGVYGMNFTHPDSPWAMPELHWYYGYPLVWGLMIAVAVGLLLYFRRKRWL